MDVEEEQRCVLSHPSQPHILILIDGRDPPSGCFTCNKQERNLALEFHYYCTACDVSFHNGCHWFPRKITHPYHFQHPLTRTLNVHSDATTYNLYDQCSWCKEDLSNHSRLYYCSICHFCLDRSCAQNLPLLTLETPKSHHHPLLFFPRPLTIPCDACGLVKADDPSYTCFQCSYVVHQSCVELPRVIKITRHRHRLSHTPYLPPVNLSCRVCYKTVDIKYGQYSCSHDDCTYVVHSRCATHENVWDKKELEWEPEEPEEDVASFKKIGHGLIKHFSHKHRLRLEKYKRVQDMEKRCRACILPINSYDFYKCIKCKFYLHEVCAGLDKKLSHALHKHTLILDPVPPKDYDSLICSACSRRTSGFRYKCIEKGCDEYQLDVRCTLIQDCFTHKSHEHPLFISTANDDEDEIFCQGCKKNFFASYIKCTSTSCDFALCYRCATIPEEVDYKFDGHPLSLCYKEDIDGGTYWCELCEKVVDKTY